jgi:hypothetical protein
MIPARRGLREDEGELSDLGEGEPRQDPRPDGVAEEDGDPPATAAFTRMTPSAAAATSSKFSKKKPTSRSIPMETKKKLVKTSLKGMTFPQSLVAVIRLGDDQPREEGPEGEERPAE